MTIKQQGGIFGRNPTFNDVEVEGNLTVGGSPISSGGTIASQDADNVDIDGGAIDGTIIGANSATSASFTTIDSAEATYGVTDSVAFALKGRTSTFGTNAIAELSIQSGATTYYNGALVVKVTPNYNSNPAVEVARFTSGGLAFVDGKGIDFSATSDAAGSTSELLDDYEEGTWTPSLGGTATYSALNANYVKVGSLVQVKATILVNAIGTGSATTITGLPYTNGDGIAALNVALMLNSATSVVHVTSSIAANSSQITMRAMAAAAASYSVTNIFGSGTYIELSGSYSTLT